MTPTETVLFAICCGWTAGNIISSIITLIQFAIEYFKTRRKHKTK